MKVDKNNCKYFLIGVLTVIIILIIFNWFNDSPWGIREKRWDNCVKNLSAKAEYYHTKLCIDVGKDENCELNEEEIEELMLADNKNLGFCDGKYGSNSLQDQYK